MNTNLSIIVDDVANFLEEVKNCDVHISSRHVCAPSPCPSLHLENNFKSVKVGFKDGKSLASRIIHMFWEGLYS